MRYAIRLPNGTADYLRKSPKGFLEALEESLEPLCEDPEKVMRRPPCPPHPPVGHFYSTRFRWNETNYAIWLCFVFHDTKYELIVSSFDTFPCVPVA